jgi:hypothetical protein
VTLTHAARLLGLVAVTLLVFVAARGGLVCLLAVALVAIAAPIPTRLFRRRG